MITEEIVTAFKQRMRIFHDTEDANLQNMLESSFLVIKNLCGEFDINNDAEGRELVFERTRYVYHDSVEFFEENFRSRIHAYGYQLAVINDVQV